MPSVNLSDRLEIHGTRRYTDEGYLQATMALTCVGVQKYTLRELGVTDSDKVVGVFRPPETVFHPDTIKSAAFKPITNNHPRTDVDATNYKHISVGSLGDRIEAIDSVTLGGTGIITDAKTVKDIEGGKSQKSLGYSTKIIEKSGVYNGVQYDYSMDGPMIVNHAAVVDRGRCGSNVKIFDKGKGETMDPEVLKALQDAGVLDEDGNAVKTDTVDVKSIADAAVAAVVRVLPGMIRTIVAAENTADTSVSDAAVDADDAPTEQDINDAVNARVALITDAQVFCGDKDITALSDRDILLTAVGDTVDGVAEMTDDALRGVLAVMKKDKAKAAGNAKSVQDSAGASGGRFDRPMSGIAIRAAGK